MQRQTLRDWVHRYNAEGVAGLLDRPNPMRARLLGPEQLAEFDRIVEAGPDVAVDGVVRWRRVDLRLVVKRRFGVVMAERTIGDLLHERGFRHLSVRPRHPRCDEAVHGGTKVGLSERGLTTATGFIERETDKFLAFWADHPFEMFFGMVFLLAALYMSLKSRRDTLLLKHQLGLTRTSVSPSKPQKAIAKPRLTYEGNSDEQS